MWSRNFKRPLKKKRKKVTQNVTYIPINMEYLKLTEPFILVGRLELYVGIKRSFNSSILTLGLLTFALVERLQLEAYIVIGEI